MQISHAPIAATALARQNHLAVKQPIPTLQFGSRRRADEDDLERRTTDSEAPPPPPSTTRKVLKWTLRSLVAAIALKAGGYFLSPLVMDSNPPGTRSVVVNKLWGGTQEKVHGEGAVWVLPGLVTNHQYDVSNQTVREYLRPNSKEGTPIEQIELALSFCIDPGEDNAYQSVRRLHTEILGSQGGISQPKHYDGESTVFSSNNPLTQAIFNQQILPRLRSSVTSLARVFKAENFHMSRTFITHGLENGYKGKFTDSDGNEQTIEVDSLRDQLKPLGIQLNFVKVEKIQLPETLQKELINRAKLPLETSIARMTTEMKREQTIAAGEFSKIETAKQEEEAKGKVDAAEIRQKGLILVADQNAKESLIRAQGQAAIALVNAEGNAQVGLIKQKGQAQAGLETARGNAEKAQILAEGSQQATVLLGEANAKKAGLDGDVYRSYTSLLKKLDLEANRDVVLQMAENAQIAIIDPKTGVRLNVIQMTAGEAGALKQLQQQLLGQAAAQKLEERPPSPPTSSVPATPRKD